MKKTIASLLLLALAGSMSAEDNLSIEGFSISASETKKVSINLTLKEATYKAIQFKLVLPDGISVALNKKGKLDFALNADRIDDHTATTKQMEDGSYSVVIASLSNSVFYEEEGELLTVSLTASEQMSSGVVKGCIIDQMLAINSNEDNSPADTEFAIIVPGTETFTGISVTTATDGAVAINVTDQAHMGQIPETAGEVSLVYTRELTKAGDADEMYTVCLPYAPPTGDGLKYYTLNAVNGTTLSFEEVASPEAYQPYLVVASGNVGVGTNSTGVNADFTTQIPAADADGYELCGTLHGMDNTTAAEAGAYILQSNGTWGKVTTENAGADIPPFRAYIVNKNGGAARLYSVLEGTTNVNVNVNDNGRDGWFDLQGRRLNGKPAKKGAYIRSGKIEIVK